MVHNNVTAQQMLHLINRNVVVFWGDGERTSGNLLAVQTGKITILTGGCYTDIRVPLISRIKEMK